VRFEREDFYPCECPERDDLNPKGPRHLDWCSALENTERANARLAEMIADARLIQGRQIGRPNSGAIEWLWCDAGNVTLADCTHTARLVQIEPIK
jgi:hypothetical protein